MAHIFPLIRLQKTLYVSFGQNFGPLQVAINLLKYLPAIAVVDAKTAEYLKGREHVFVSKNWLELVYTILKVMSSSRPKVVHWNFPPIFLSPILLLTKFLRVKTVYSFHGGILFESRSSLQRILFLLQCRYLYDCIIANSQYSANFLFKINKKLNEKTVVIPNGVETKNNVNVVQIGGNPSVLFVGRLAKIKGVDILPKAVALAKKELPDLCLHIIGDGPLKSKIEELTTNYDLTNNLVLHGFVPESIKQEFYYSVDFVVIPSLCEPFGLTILEAMVAGKPVVAANRGAFPELIYNGENGFLVEPTSEAFASAIIKLARDFNLAKEIMRVNKKAALKYSWRKIAKKYETLIYE
jgi:glycosyltransferase involved in cell wall biosynthesis